MQTNSKRETAQTHEGARAVTVKPLAALRRSLMACLLWESEFYEDGVEIAERIANLAHECEPGDVAKLAIEARTQQKLRHAPLLLARELARHPRLAPPTAFARSIIANTIERVIERADEVAEFLALYWRDGKTPISKQVKLGLGRALRKFDEYQLAKYDRDGRAVRLRDVLFLTHAKPNAATGDDQFTIAPGVDRGCYKRGDTKRHLRDQGALWHRLAEQKLKTPDTWEVALSGGADKRATFERLIKEGKLGYLALLRNLRNMTEAGCDVQLVRDAIALRKGAERVLPFRFIAAARVVPQFETEIDAAMLAGMANMERLPGRTVVLVDNSGSMYAPLSSKSDLTRADAAAGLAIFVRGISESVRVFAFSDNLVEVPARTGMALRDALQAATIHGSTYLGAAVKTMNELSYDRLIVITDEQSHDIVPNPKGRAYMINIASSKNGVGYGPWVHVDGWSEQLISFIQEYEAQYQVDAQ